MTASIVTELRRNGNTMVDRPTADRRPPARRLTGQPSQTQPHTNAINRLQPRIGPSMEVALRPGIVSVDNTITKEPQ